MNKNPLSNWWAIILNGVIAILYGLLALFAPANTLNVIVKYFGFVVLIIGVAMMIGVINNYRKQQTYAGDLVSSILAIALGAILAFYTSEAIKIFVIIIGVWSILLGAGLFVLYAQIQANSGSKNTILITGFLALALGIILFFTPLQSASVMVFITGALSLIVGIILISMAVVVKNSLKQTGS